VPADLHFRVLSFLRYGGYAVTAPAFNASHFHGRPFVSAGQQLHDRIDRLGNWLKDLLADAHTCRSVLAPGRDDVPLGLVGVDALGADRAAVLRCIADVFACEAPHWSQVLFCRPSTSVDDVRLFLERARHAPSSVHLLVAANELPMPCVELLLSSMLSKSGAAPPTRAIVAPSASVDVSVDGVATSRVLALFTNDCNLRRVCPKSMLVGGSGAAKFASPMLEKLQVTVVYGAAGDGKTFWITEKLREQPSRIAKRQVHPRVVWALDFVVVVTCWLLAVM
jgi:hypothetical protein